MYGRFGLMIFSKCVCYFNSNSPRLAKEIKFEMHNIEKTQCTLCLLRNQYNCNQAIVHPQIV